MEKVIVTPIYKGDRFEGLTKPTSYRPISSTSRVARSIWKNFSTGSTFEVSTNHFHSFNTNLGFFLTARPSHNSASSYKSGKWHSTKVSICKLLSMDLSKAFERIDHFTYYCLGSQGGKLWVAMRLLGPIACRKVCRNTAETENDQSVVLNRRLPVSTFSPNHWS